MVAPMSADWLSRLEGAPSFSELPTASPAPQPRSLGGLAAGALPNAVRSSHGYVPQFPSDSPVPLRPPRRGDLFRNP
jgi:hypothetical protein